MALYRLEDGSGLVAGLLGVQRQVVLRFTDAAQRTAQLRVPELGMLTFLNTTKSYDWWNGTAWVALVPTTTRVPTVQRVGLNGTTVTTGPTTQATVTVPAVGYDRAVEATFVSYGHATGDPSSLWYFQLSTTLTGAGAVVTFMNRDPITATDQSVLCSTVAALPAGTAVTVTAFVTRASGPASTWVYTNLSDLTRNRLDVAAV